jgi:hypothetical protein
MSPLAIALCVPLAIAAVGCLLVLLDPGDDLAIRPLPPEGLEAVSAGQRPRVPDSPNLHHYAEGRVPVTGRVVAPEDTHDWARAPRVTRLHLAHNWRDAVVAITWSTL